MKHEAAECNHCEKIEKVHKGSAHPQDWYLIFGPNGRLDFCSQGCLFVYFSKICQPIPIDLIRRDYEQTNEAKALT